MMAHLRFLRIYFDILLFVIFRWFNSSKFPIFSFSIVIFLMRIFTCLIKADNDDVSCYMVQPCNLAEITKITFIQRLP